MAIVLFCLLWLIALLFPETPVAGLFRRLLVELPARLLTPGRAAVALVVIAAATLILGWMKADGVGLLAQGLPEGVGWLVTFDIASYVDVAIVAVAAAATVRMRGLGALARHATTKLARGFRRLAVPRTGRRRRPSPPKADDDGWRGFAPAMA